MSLCRTLGIVLMGVSLMARAAPASGAPSGGRQPPLMVAIGGSMGGALVGTARPPLDEDGLAPVAFSADVAFWGMRSMDARLALGGSLGLGVEKTEERFDALRLRARVGFARPFLNASRPLLLSSLGVDGGPVVEYLPHASSPPGAGLEISVWGMFSFLGIAVTGRTSTHELAAVYLSLLMRLALPVFQ